MSKQDALARLKEATGAARVVGEPVKVWGVIKGYWVGAQSAELNPSYRRRYLFLAQGRGDSYEAAVDDAIRNFGSVGNRRARELSRERA